MSENPQVLPPVSTARTSVMAIVSLIAGILGFVQAVPVLGPIVAVVTGHLAKSEIKNSAGTIGGGGMATAGLILGYVALALSLCACLVLVLVWAGLFTLPFTIPFISNFLPTPSY
jgi:hypothetical protein